MTRKSRARVAGAAVVVLSGVLIAGPRTGARDAQDQPPRFRTGIDVIRLEVSVLDRERRPVRGLTKADFTILVDGRPQPVVALSEIELPGAEPPSAPWMREVPFDVRTNAVAEARLFVLILDDALVPSHPSMIQTTKRTARAIVDRLGREDLMSIVFTRDNSNAQDFTNDRTRLVAAIDRFNSGFIPACLAKKYSMNALNDASKFLAELPTHRTSVIYLSVGPAVTASSDAQSCPGGGTLPGMRVLDEDQELSMELAMDRDLQVEASRQALGNVRIYGINPAGLAAPGPAITGLPSARAVDRGNEFLRTVSNRSGGFAIANTNAPDMEIRRIFEENASHYLVGYQPQYPLSDGRYRRLQIRVNRDDVTVLPEDRRVRSPKPATRKTEPEPPAAVALSGLIPKADLPLLLTVAPFASAEGPRAGEKASVVVALGIPQPGDDIVDNIAIDARVFDGEGRKQIAIRTQTVEFPAIAGRVRGSYNVVSRLDLKPGRYNLRVGAFIKGSRKSGSVYADVVVPDFGREALSMSGVILSASGMSESLEHAADDVVPNPPTTRRQFSVDDDVTAFVRVYQGGKRPVAAANVRVRIVDSSNTTVFEREQWLGPDAFGGRRAADYRLALPIDRLTAGVYVLRLEAEMSADARAGRDVRFSLLRRSH